jgi:hypothetical protein
LPAARKDGCTQGRRFSFLPETSHQAASGGGFQDCFIARRGMRRCRHTTYFVSVVIVVDFSINRESHQSALANSYLAIRCRAALAQSLECAFEVPSRLSQTICPLRNLPRQRVEHRPNLASRGQSLLAVK